MFSRFVNALVDEGPTAPYAPTMLLGSDAGDQGLGHPFADAEEPELRALRRRGDFI